MIQVILYQYSLSGPSQGNALHNCPTAGAKPKKATNVIVIGSRKAIKKHNILQDVPFSYGYVPLRVVRSYVLLESRAYGIQFDFPIINLLSRVFVPFKPLHISRLSPSSSTALLSSTSQLLVHSQPSGHLIFLFSSILSPCLKRVDKNALIQFCMWRHINNHPLLVRRGNREGYLSRYRSWNC